MYKKIKIVLDIIKKVWYKVVIPKGKMRIGDFERIIKWKIISLMN